MDVIYQNHIWQVLHQKIPQYYTYTLNLLKEIKEISVLKDLGNLINLWSKYTEKMTKSEGRIIQALLFICSNKLL
jgi:hypothetical protein